MLKLLRISMLLLALLTTLRVSAQDRAVTGKVTSSDDSSPLVGVSVLVKGSTQGATTDANGAYRLSIPNGPNTLVFSYVGFNRQEVAVGNRTALDVVLVADASSLNEVVITGYTTLTKRQDAGANVKVDAIKFASMPMASFDQSLQGLAPGVLVTANSGQPGAAAQVRIRGVGSINGSNTPLYVVDGIQISAGNFTSINSGDFESVTVLKDAEATALYGSRGANGVIVVTTKRGKAGKGRVEYEGQYGGATFPENRLEVMNTQEKIDYELYRNSFYPAGQGTALQDFSPAEIDKLRKINTNWQKELFQTSITQSHQLSFSGGSDKLLYYASGSVFSQGGTVKGTGLDRYTGRLSLESTQGNLRFGFSGQLGYSYYKNTTEANTGIASPLNAIRWANPYEKPYNDDGSYQQFLSGQPNPVQEQEESRRGTNELKGIGTGFLEYNFPFLKGLSARTNWGIDYENWEQEFYVSRNSRTGTSTGVKGRAGLLDRGFRRLTRATGTTSLNFVRTVDQHAFRVSVFQEAVRTRLASFGYRGYGLTGILQNEAGITGNSATYIPDVSGNATANALISFFATANYGFRERYYLNATVRRDGSSRFGAGRKYATFGSVGASWVLSDEGFMDGIKGNWLNLAKLRLSYGTVGNQEGIGDFASRALYSVTGRGTYDGGQTSFLGQLENPDLQWEQKTTANLGLDFVLFANRISASVDVYDAQTTNLFLNDQLSRTTGFPSINRNLGRLQNRGFEIGLNTVNVRLSGFEWRTTINYAINQNKVKELAPTSPTIGAIDGVVINRVGFPVNSNYLVEYAGVNPQTGAQSFRRPSGETTSEYNPNDRQIFGRGLAPYTGSVSNTFAFRGLELSALFTFAYGNYIYNNDRTNVEIPDYFGDNVSRALLREWKNPGDITNIPNPLLPYQTGTTHFLEKGDFLRLRNVVLSYTFPTRFNQRSKLGSLRLYVQGQNLLTFTNFQSFDPEIAGSILTGAQYPALRQLTGGLRIAF